jgi:hypothetical protein
MEHKTLTKAKFLEILKKKEATEDVQLDKVELHFGAKKGPKLLWPCGGLPLTSQGQRPTQDL